MAEENTDLNQEANERTSALALEAFKPFEHFSKCLIDAYVVVDTKGRVVKSNQLFSTITGMKSRQIVKAGSLDEILALKVGDKKISVNELIKAQSPTRIDEVICQCSGKSEELNLIIGVYPFLNGIEPIGAFLLIRDATAEASLQDKYKDKAKKSITDSLTGLYNRNYFSEFLTSQLAHLETLPKDATQRDLSLLMIDIDYFKKINDQFGHPAGDFVLKQTAEIMRNTFRKNDIICRYGGEEFLVILPGTDHQGALVAGEKFRKSVEQHRFDFEGKVIPVTLSSGVAQVLVSLEYSEQVMARADAALYHSKKNGRNQVSFHDGSKIIPYSAGHSPMKDPSDKPKVA